MNAELYELKARIAAFEATMAAMEIKHQQGKHNQKDHARGRGGGKGSGGGGGGGGKGSGGGGLSFKEIQARDKARALQSVGKIPTGYTPVDAGRYKGADFAVIHNGKKEPGSHGIIINYNDPRRKRPVFELGVASDAAQAKSTARTRIDQFEAKQ